MSRTESAELTFASFHHSQGSFPLQLAIFGYLEKVQGILPDLMPIGSDRDRYIDFVSANNGSHLQLGVRRIASVLVDNTFEYLYDNWKTERPRYRSLDEDKIVLMIASSILNVENKILDQNTPWSSETGYGQEARRQRFTERVRSGRSSFLFYYGRDGHPAGHPAYNDMYARAWKIVSIARGRGVAGGFLDVLVETHGRNVAAAEINCLGRPILASHPYDGISPDLSAEQEALAE